MVVGGQKIDFLNNDSAVRHRRLMDEQGHIVYRASNSIFRDDKVVAYNGQKIGSHVIYQIYDYYLFEDGTLDVMADIDGLRTIIIRNGEILLDRTFISNIITGCDAISLPICASDRDHYYLRLVNSSHVIKIGTDGFKEIEEPGGGKLGSFYNTRFPDLPNMSNCVKNKKNQHICAGKNSVLVRDDGKIFPAACCNHSLNNNGKILVVYQNGIQLLDYDEDAIAGDPYQISKKDLESHRLEIPYEKLGIPSNYVVPNPWAQLTDKGDIGLIFDYPAGYAVIVRATPSGSTATPGTIKRPSPLLIVPGIAGSFVNAGDRKDWYLKRGFTPDKLVIDPIIYSYDDLLETLKNAGYRLGIDLFAATYDWRLPVAPEDGSRDGKISGINAKTITDSNYQYSVDYLGYWLKKAAEAWKKNYPDAPPLESVDVIAHSTGGLVTRAYIQSEAHGGSIGNSNLPKIGKFIMLGVPNQGAVKAWNPINDNWSSDLAYALVIRNFANIPYQWLLKDKTKTLSIKGPTPISQKTVTEQSKDPNFESDASKKAFLDQYVPSLKALLATYDFGAEVKKDQENSLLLDLNANFSSVTNSTCVTVVHGNGFKTATSVQHMTGPVKYNCSTPKENTNPSTANKKCSNRTIESFTEFHNRAPRDNEQWWEEKPTPDEEKPTLDGDGTVPTKSSTYIKGKMTESNIKGKMTESKREFDNVDHTELPSNKEVQKFILETLGAKVEDEQISTNKKTKLTREVGCNLYHDLSFDSLIDLCKTNPDNFNEQR